MMFEQQYKTDGVKEVEVLLPPILPQRHSSSTEPDRIEASQSAAEPDEVCVSKEGKKGGAATLPPIVEAGAILTRADSYSRNVELIHQSPDNNSGLQKKIESLSSLRFTASRSILGEVAPGADAAGRDFDSSMPVEEDDFVMMKNRQKEEAAKRSKMMMQKGSSKDFDTDRFTAPFARSRKNTPMLQMDVFDREDQGKAYKTASPMIASPIGSTHRVKTLGSGSFAFVSSAASRSCAEPIGFAGQQDSTTPLAGSHHAQKPGFFQQSRSHAGQSLGNLSRTQKSTSSLWKMARKSVNLGKSGTCKANAKTGLKASSQRTMHDDNEVYSDFENFDDFFKSIAGPSPQPTVTDEDKDVRSAEIQGMYRADDGRGKGAAEAEEGAITEMGEDAVEAGEGAITEMGEDAVEAGEGAITEMGEDAVEAGEGAITEMGEDAVEAGEGAITEMGEDTVEAGEGAITEMGEDTVEAGEGAITEMGEDAVEAGEGAITEMGEDAAGLIKEDVGMLNCSRAGSAQGVVDCRESEVAASLVVTLGVSVEFEGNEPACSNPELGISSNSPRPRRALEESVKDNGHDGGMESLHGDIQEFSGVDCKKRESLIEKEQEILPSVLVSVISPRERTGLALDLPFESGHGELMLQGGEKGNAASAVEHRQDSNLALGSEKKALLMDALAGFDKIAGVGRAGLFLKVAKKEDVASISDTTKNESKYNSLEGIFRSGVGKIDQNPGKIGRKGIGGVQMQKLASNGKAMHPKSPTFSPTSDGKAMHPKSPTFSPTSDGKAMHPKSPTFSPTSDGKAMHPKSPTFSPKMSLAELKIPPAVVLMTDGEMDKIVAARAIPGEEMNEHHGGYREDNDTFEKGMPMWKKKGRRYTMHGGVVPPWRGPASGEESTLTQECFDKEEDLRQKILEKPGPGHKKRWSVDMLSENANTLEVIRRIADEGGKQRGSAGDLREDNEVALGPWARDIRTANQGSNDQVQSRLQSYVQYQSGDSQILDGNLPVSTHDPNAWKLGLDDVAIQIQEAMWVKKFMEEKETVGVLVFLQAHCRMAIHQRWMIRDKQARMYAEGMTSDHLKLAAAITCMVMIKVQRMRAAKKEEEILVLHEEILEKRQVERDAKMAEWEFKPVEISVSLRKKVAETVAGPSQSMKPKPPDAPPQHLRSPMRKLEQFYKAKKRYVPKKNFFTREHMAEDPETDEQLFTRLLAVAKVYNKEHGIEYVTDLVGPVSDERMQESELMTAAKKEKARILLLEKEGNAAAGDQPEPEDSEYLNNFAEAKASSMRKEEAPLNQGCGVVWKKADHEISTARCNIRAVNSSTNQKGIALELKEIWNSISQDSDETSNLYNIERPAADNLMKKLVIAQASDRASHHTPLAPKERPGEELQRLQKSPRKEALLRRNQMSHGPQGHHAGSKSKDAQKLHREYEEMIAKEAAAREKELREKRLKDAAIAAEMRAEEMLNLLFLKVKGRKS